MSRLLTLKFPLTALILTTALVLTVNAQPASAQSILFIKGGPGTGGFLEGGADEQLSSITDYSTAGGNHGWGELNDLLIDNGFTTTQMVEGPASNNTPVDLVSLDLSAYDVIVFGSNNADYPAAAVDKIETWIQNGGGALFISDANWGRNWGDAPDSDQPFLDRFGLVMNQDTGTYALTRSAGDYVVDGEDQGDHPILAGIDAFDGEGVSPGTVVDTSIPGVTPQVLANAEGNIRVNDNYGGGSFRPAAVNDGALIAVEAGTGRLAIHFDRNTFFNLNGAGTNINRLDNADYAVNLFTWLAGPQQASVGAAWRMR